jgi:pyruvate dehydrogenase E1 component
MDHGMRRLLEQQADEFYYVTVMNENYAQPSLPAGAQDGIVKGLYRYGEHRFDGARGQVRLLGSGAILREVIAAAQLLASDWQIASEVYSATSFGELARAAREAERWNRLHPEQPPRRSHLEEMLPGDAPVVAATDYVRAYPQLIASYLDARFVALGSDGFGRSDTRSALRGFFEIDRYHVVLAALDALARQGTVERSLLAQAIARYGVDPGRAPPWTC